MKFVFCLRPGSGQEWLITDTPINTEGKKKQSLNEYIGNYQNIPV